MRTIKIILGIAVLIVTAVILYKHAYPTYTYRFHLSIAVNVGSETRTASSVIEVHAVTRPDVAIFSPITNKVRGEAAFFDLGANGNVVVLLGCNPNGTQDCIGTLVPNEFAIKNYSDLEKLRGSIELSEKYFPTLATFSDLNDPSSGRVVRPDQFEQVFGSDVHFKRAWIEMTKDPVTRGIEQKMPMLMSHRDSMRRAYGDVGKFTAQYHLFIRD